MMACGKSTLFLRGRTPISLGTWMFSIEYLILSKKPSAAVYDAERR
jgi:hypothetical protein